MHVRSDKLFISDHSLGHALALISAGMLCCFGEHSVTDTIASAYTFRQPRVADDKFCQFMILENLKVERYFKLQRHH